jgi:AraC-like DNA-binding protein
MKTILKKHGFPDERHTIVPRRAIQHALTAPVTRDLILTSIGHFPQAAGHFITRPHGLKDETILIYCAEGEGWCHLSEKQQHIAPGTAIIIPAGTPHNYGAAENNPWTIFWVHFMGIRVKDYLNVILSDTYHNSLYLHHTGEILHHFESLYSLLDSSRSSAGMVALSTSLANFLGHIALYRSPMQPIRTSGIDRVQQTIPFMRRHITSDISVCELAGIAELSIPHYSTLFRSLTGSSPKAYFLHLKMQEAARMLATSNLTVQDIATHIGIQDPYYFSRIFKKIMKKPPSEYRKTHNTAS